MVIKFAFAYPTVEVTLSELLSIGRAKYGVRAPNDVCIITEDNFADRAIKGAVSDQYGNLLARFQDWSNAYYCELDNSQATKDFRLMKSVGGTVTELGYEAVDIGAGNIFELKLSANGSSLKAFRTDMATAKITATDTSFTSGMWGIKFVWSGYKSFALWGLAKIMAPASLSPELIGYFEVPVIGSGTAEDSYRPLLPQEITDDPLWGRINRLGISYSALIRTEPNGKPLRDTCIIRVFETERQPHIRPIPECLNAIRTLGISELTRDEAIRKALKYDDRLHPSDLVSIPEPKPNEVREYMKHQEQLGNSAELLNEEASRQHIKLGKGW